MYIFLTVLLSDQCLLEDDELDDNNNETRQQVRIISIAQDLIYTANGYKFHTPKPIGMANSLNHSYAFERAGGQVSQYMSYHELP